MFSPPEMILIAEPVLDEDEALLIDATDVTEYPEQPSAVTASAVASGYVVVPLHQLRCAEPQFARLTYWDLLKGVRVDHPHGPADRRCRALRSVRVRDAPPVAAG